MLYHSTTVPWLKTRFRSAKKIGDGSCLFQQNREKFSEHVACGLLILCLAMFPQAEGKIFPP